MFRPKPPLPPPPAPGFSAMQVVEMAGGTVLAALVIYIAHTVTSLPARISGMEQGQQQILNNQNRIENGMDAIRGELRSQDRRLTKLESQ